MNVVHVYVTYIWKKLVTFVSRLQKLTWTQWALFFLNTVPDSQSYRLLPIFHGYNKHVYNTVPNIFNSISCISMFSYFYFVLSLLNNQLRFNKRIVLVQLTCIWIFWSYWILELRSQYYLLVCTSSNYSI